MGLRLGAYVHPSVSARSSECCQPRTEHNSIAKVLSHPARSCVPVSGL